MSHTSLSVWFVCRLCRGSFGQVDAFIEHKKQKHFTQFQNTTSIVFEERELGQLYPIISSNGEHQIADEISDPLIKIEVTDDDPAIPFSSDIIKEPNFYLVKVKSELITYENKINPDNENNFFGLKQPEQNPYVLLKRLTSEEIQRACAPQYQHHSSLLRCERTIFTNTHSFEPPNSSDASPHSYYHNELNKSTENPPTAPVIHFSRKPDQHFECKLCSKQLESDAKLTIHLGICALYHKHRNRFCVMCNRKFSSTDKLKDHRLRFHGTEEEKLSLYKFKCHLCSKQYRQAVPFSLHLETHKKNKQNIVKMSKSKPVKCLHPNCVTEFRFNYLLQRHIAAVHLGVKPFSCHFPNCNKSFSQRGILKRHFLIHTGERPFKCTVVNCNKAFRTSQHRSLHHQSAHSN